MSGLEGDTGDYGGDQWISAADLLGGALVIFLLLMLYFMMTQQEQSEEQTEDHQEIVARLETQLQQVRERATQTEAELQSADARALPTTDRFKEVAVTYDKKRAELYQALKQEFSTDLPRWNAEIDEDLTIRFKEPDILFDVGSARIKQRFVAILSNFFPRYLETIRQAEFYDAIDEIRIEGHTSSFWNRANPTPPQEAYLRNMDLSYSRSRSVLRFVMGLEDTRPALPWLRKHLTANGLSSSQLILDANGEEDWRRSQRVEFRIRTDVEQRIERILQAG